MNPESEKGRPMGTSSVWESPGVRGLPLPRARGLSTGDQTGKASSDLYLRAWLSVWNFLHVGSFLQDKAI